MNYQKKFLLTVSYDGTDFSGWQTQKNSTSIQSILEEKLSMLLRQKVALTGSGRTDSGVHAYAQKAHFETDQIIDSSNIVYRLNAVLPTQIRVLDCQAVQESFHARFDVKKKTYEYLVYNHKIMDPFLNGKAWHVPYALDYELMLQAISLLQGEHDFKAFAAKNTQGTASVDSIRNLEVFAMKKENHLIRFTLSSKGFLYRMVRNLVGSVIDVGSKQITLDDLKKAFDSKIRHDAGQTAPAHGLYLKDVAY